MSTLLFAIATLGCGMSAPEPEVVGHGPAPAQHDPQQRALAAAEALVTDKLASMHRSMVQQVGATGPGAAEIECSIEAGELERLPARGHPEPSSRTGRTSLRLRNPANEAPDWVGAWLQEQGEGPATGVVGLSTVDAERARVLRPIAMESRCLRCHGDDEALDPRVRQLVSGLYPDDAAVGYVAGDLRGAVWAEVPVTP